jgi:hypothetical protein
LLNGQALSSNLNSELRLNEYSFGSKNSQSSTEEMIDSSYLNEKQQIILAQNKADKMTEEWANKCQKCFFIYEVKIFRHYFKFWSLTVFIIRLVLHL